MQSIDEYVNELRTVKGDKPAGKDEKRKTHKALTLMFAILAESGHEVPDALDKAEYRRRNTSSEAAISQDMSRIDRYFAVQAGGDIAHEPSRAGRKCLDTENGERRSEKLMLYLTPSMIADVRTWCDLKGISCVNYITGLLEADIAGKREKLKEFLSLRSKA